MRFYEDAGERQAAVLQFGYFDEYSRNKAPYVASFRNPQRYTSYGETARLTLKLLK
jgi:hypothetical protein